MSKQRVTILLMVVVFFVMIINVATVQATERKVNWDRLSENLVDALQSDNPGLQQSAMRLVIQFADKVDVSEATNDLMHIYRYSEDTKERQLALVTLHKIGSDYAMDFAKRNMKYESDEKIKKMSSACVSNHNNVVTADVAKDLALK